MRLHLLAYRNLASHFIKEVFEEDHLVLRLLSFRWSTGISAAMRLCSGDQMGLRSRQASS
jgi:hypothetical protein